MMTQAAKSPTRSARVAPVIVIVAAFVGSALFNSRDVRAQASHTVEIGIRPITAIAVSTNPAPLILSGTSHAWSDSWSADGSDSISDQSSTYRLTSNVRGAMIIASLDAPMPTDTRLSIRLESTIGTSRGSLDFSSGDVDAVAVSDMQPGLENNRSILIEFVSDSELPVPIQNRMLALTLIDPVSGRSDTAYQTITFGAPASHDLTDAR